MTKTLTVNIGGMVYTIDEDAYQLLETYLNNLKRHFVHEEGADEILSDMEQRMGELFSERIESKNQIITLKDVEEVIKLMGQPEDFQEEEDKEQGHAEAKQEKNAGEKQKGERRLFRDPDDVILGGVLSGVSHYFDWDPTMVRLIVVLLSITTLHVGIGTLLLVYIIAWAIIPKASDAADRLAMHGEKVNVENIGKTVTNGFERATNFVKDPKTHSTARRLGEGLVNFFGMLAKILLVLLAIAFAPIAFVLIVVSFALIMAGFGIVASLPFLFESLPFLGDVLALQISPVYVWVLAICAIIVAVLPLFALIHALFHHFGNAQPMGVYTRVTLITVWVVALFAAISCIGHLSLML